MRLLSVIVPVYNEASTIIQILEAADAVNIDKEIIVINDGSCDGTAEKLRNIEYGRFNSLKIIHHSSNRGKGAAFITGLKEASGEFVIIQDADLEYNPGEYPGLLECAQKYNLCVVYGSRFISGRGSTSLFHYLVNWFLTRLTNLLYGSSLTDMETCYKLIKREVLKDLDLKAKRFELEPEITIKLLKNKYKIQEVPISYNRRLYSKGKKIGWKDGIAALVLLIKLRFTK